MKFKPLMELLDDNNENVQSFLPSNVIGNILHSETCAAKTKRQVARLLKPISERADEEFGYERHHKNNIDPWDGEGNDYPDLEVALDTLMGRRSGMDARGKAWKWLRRLRRETSLFKKSDAPYKLLDALIESAYEHENGLFVRIRQRTIQDRQDIGSRRTLKWATWILWRRGILDVWRMPGRGKRAASFIESIGSVA